MKNAIFTLTVFMTALLTGLPAQAQVSFGNATKFNEDWLFRLTDDSTIVNPAFNDRNGANSDCRMIGLLKDNFHLL